MLTTCLGKKPDYKPLIEKSDYGSEYIISNIDIFNGVDSVLLRNQSVLVKDGLIADIANELEVGNAIKVIDGSDKYLIPGFVDSHVHIMASGSAPWAMIPPNPEHNLEAWLATGVTTIYDLGGIATQSKKHKARIEKGEIFGPSIYYTGSPITAPNGHPIAASKALLPFPLSLFIGFIIESADKETDIPKLISDYEEDDVDYIKIINDELPVGVPQIDQQVMKSIIDESHQRDLKTFVHIGNLDNMLSAIESGADILAHFPYRDSVSEVTVNKIKGSGVKVIYTLAGFENTYQISKGNYASSQLDIKLQPHELLDAVTGKAGLEINNTEVLDQFSETLSDHHNSWESTFRLFRENDIPFTIGTDSPLPGSYAGSGFHEEMKMLKAMGYSEFTILKAATSAGADLFLDNADFGAVKKGKVADLVILNGDPLEDIANTSDIHLVIKKGDVYKSIW